MWYFKHQLRRTARTLSRTVVLGALLVPLLFLGCSTDSPTQPTPNPQPPPTGGGGATSFVISVTANPSTAPASADAPIAVTVTVRRADNGQAPPNGTTLGISTTLGNFVSPANGPQSTNLSLIGGSAQINLFANGLVGTARVQAQLQSSVGAANVVFTEIGTFFIQAISPTSGSPDGGSRITITGGGFVEPVRVFIGGQIAQVVSVTDTRIVALSPQVSLPVGQTSTVDVTVTNALNTPNEATDSLIGVFTYRRSGGGALQPQVFSVTPGSGPNEGGTRVTIQGEGFVSPVQVLFGTGSANAFTGTEAQIQSVSSTQIVAISPAATGFGQNNQNSTVAILVRNLNDGATALFGTAFQYGTSVLVTSVGPGSVSYLGGDRVTIFGQGFDEPVAITAGNVTQAPISVTGTEIIFRASAVEIVDCEPMAPGGGAATGPVLVVNIESGAGNTTGPVFSYVGPNPPFITSIAPGTVAQAGGTSITLGGGNFVAPVTVTIDGALATVTSVSGTQVVVNAPPISSASFDTVTCNDNGDGQPGTRNIPTVNSLSFSLRNVATGCVADNVNVNFTVTPTDTSCQDDIAPVDPPTPPVADFSFVINGNQVDFINQSTGNPTSYLWQFGNPGNSTSTNVNPTFTYPGPGSYTVRLTASNSAGANTAIKLVTIP